VREPLNFSKWVDLSPGDVAFNEMANKHMVRFKCKHTFTLSQKAHKTKGDQRDKIKDIMPQKNKKDKKRFTLIKDPGEIQLYPHYLIINEKRGGKPWFINKCIFNVMDAFMLGAITRALMFVQMEICECRYDKYIIE
jgi:hypothetical protein